MQRDRAHSKVRTSCPLFRLILQSNQGIQMPKISSGTIKALISTKWLNKPEIISKAVSLFSPNDTYAIAEINKKFAIGKLWKRWVKCCVGNEDSGVDIGNFFHLDPRTNKVILERDFAFEGNQKLMEDVCKGVIISDKCIYRRFEPELDHSPDTFRLEVITTPDDTEIVGWWVYVD
jgi:hypothetical protein